MAILTSIPGTMKISNFAPVAVDPSGRAHTWSYVPPKSIPGNQHPISTRLREAHDAAIVFVELAISAARSLVADPTLSLLGMRKAFTQQMAIGQLEGLAKYRVTLDKEVKRIDDEEARLQTETEVKPVKPAGSDIERLERLELAKAFRALSGRERKVAEESVKDGEDPQLADALVYTHRYISGVGPGLQGLLRFDAEKVRIDQEKTRELKAARWRVDSTIALFDDSKLALLKASDLDELTKVGLVPESPASMSIDDRIGFIEKHGLDAYTDAYARHLEATVR